MLVELQPWCRRFSRLMHRWQRETNPEISAFVLPGVGGIHDERPLSYGILVDGELLGRYTIRVHGFQALTGIYLSPPARNKGVAIPASTLGLDLARSLGAVLAVGDVAAPNRPAIWLNTRLGYTVRSGGEWRALPDDFPLDLMWRWNTEYWRYLPEPAVWYKQMDISLIGRDSSMAERQHAKLEVAGSTPDSRLHGH